ncbi:NUDIX hydrolase [Rhodonellum psychrophilum GCM71 = DSM 17998]|uniref:NUDIX hydrolase n=2 Tax=Rhodonellum TaxID=336827 RepID=U5C2N9_9BACT|nr:MULTISPECIES: NUDIX hydrolase [Rhodonellum]ERM82432.1 NUDIX hydrolase [Rhodonellum psychrophilum GCM71 = DSM 17998]MDO9553205.1 NUDIX hydrolase [Rhodonellum sp.]SDY88056.1 ADP-ribose pyrophosphatase YjhB, NUDIX family [Rhodonellum ikkaensis]
MKIFINDKPVDILLPKDLPEEKTFECIYDNPQDFPATADFHDDVLIIEPSKDVIIKLLYLLRNRKLKNLDSVTLVCAKKNEVTAFIKSRFTIIKAAGGIVTKGQKALFIFRLGKWDLPKGKFEKGESPLDCALREVEEECNIKVKLGPEICKTWHTYTQDRKSILKKTYWYAMENINDVGMKPQKEEGIDDIRWMTHHEAKVALVNSYPSMRYLYKRFLRMEQTLHN